MSEPDKKPSEESEETLPSCVLQQSGSKACLLQHTHSNRTKSRQPEPLEELFFTGLCGMRVRPGPLRPTSWLAGWHSCLTL